MFIKGEKESSCEMLCSDWRILNLLKSSASIKSFICQYNIRQESLKPNYFIFKLNEETGQKAY